MTVPAGNLVENFKAMRNPVKNFVYLSKANRNIFHIPYREFKCMLNPIRLLDLNPYGVYCKNSQLIV